MSALRRLLREHSEDAWAAVGLALYAVVLFLPALSPSRTLFQRDIVSFWYPHVEAMLRAAGSGSWPLWNPDFTFGMPLWEDPNYQIAYPPTWLNLLMLPPTYFKLYGVGHAFMAALGLYAYLRQRGAAPLSAFVGGATFAASGPFLSVMGMWIHYASAAWMGWVLFAQSRLLAQKTVTRALALGLCAGLLALAGSAEVVALTALLCAVALLVQGGLDGRGARLLGLAVAFAAAVAAIVWLPAIVYLAQSGARLSLTSASKLYWSLHPACLVDLFVPLLTTESVWNPAIRELLFESREPYLASIYAGVAVMGLGLLAVVGRRDRVAYGWAAAAALLVLIALGKYTPVGTTLAALRGAMPFRYPVKAVLGASVAWAVLAALGFEYWRRPWGPRDRTVARTIAALLAGVAIAAGAAAYATGHGTFDFALAGAGESAAPAARLAVTMVVAALVALLVGRRSARANDTRGVTGLLAVVLLADLAWSGMGTNKSAPAALLTERPPIVEHLGVPFSGLRVQVLPPSFDWIRANLTRGPRDWQLEWRWVLGYKEMLVAPTAARWGFAGAFDGDFTGLTPAPIPFMSGIVHRGGDLRALEKLLAIGSVDYVIAAAAPLDSPRLSPIASLPSVYAAPIRLYRVVGAVPRAYVVGGAQVAADPAAAVQKLLADDFEPLRDVILAAGTPRAAPADFNGHAQVVRRGSSVVEIDVEASHAGFLVLVDAYAPGWNASVDGAPVPVERANAAFRSVSVPAGRHHVVVAYRPAAILVGGALSLGALLLALAIALHGRRAHSTPFTDGAK